MKKELERLEKLERNKQKAENVNNILLRFLKSYLRLNDTLRTQNQGEVQIALAELYKELEVYNNSMMNGPYNKTYQPYKSIQDLLYELEGKTIKESKYLSILKELPSYEGFLCSTVLINGDINPIIKENFHLLSQSRVKKLLDICRENAHIPYSNELYTYIRMSLNKASMTLRELLKIIERVQEIDTENILGSSPLEFYLSGPESYGKPLFAQGSYQPEIARFCNHCNRLIQHNETKCKGHKECSYYYKKGEPWYREVKLNPDDMYDKIYTVPDEYYDFVTLPNLFEEIVYSILRELLSEGEFEVTLHPNIERLGDIMVFSKLTKRKYLIDCKNYNNPTNLKKYVLDNNGTLIKSLINKDSDFIFVVPSHHMNANLLAYISGNKDINKYGYTIKNDLNIANFIIKEDSKCDLVF